MKVWPFPFLYILTDWPKVTNNDAENKSRKDCNTKLEFGYAFWMHMPCKKFATILGSSTMHEVKSNLWDFFLVGRDTSEKRTTEL